MLSPSVALAQYARRRAVAEALVVLVVEDEQSLQSILEEALSDGGFQSEIASSGEEALTLLSGRKGAYRVLVVDIRFGKDRIKGWDVARRARASAPELPVIYITGANADEWAIQGVPNSVPVDQTVCTGATYRRRCPTSEYRINHALTALLARTSSSRSRRRWIETLHGKAAQNLLSSGS